MEGKDGERSEGMGRKRARKIARYKEKGRRERDKGKE